jgi:hypothetical protein
VETGSPTYQEGKNVKKRYRRGFWAALLAAVLLFVGVSSAFRTGLHVGYRWGFWQSQDGEEVGPQGPPIYSGRWPVYRGYWGWPRRGGFLGRLLALLLVLLGIRALFGAFRHKAWHMHRAHGPHPRGPWGSRSPCGHGPAKPDDADESPTDEQVAKVQPEPDTD